ncbi:MAG: PLP-dependent aminotransferase family protein [Chloroflexi bacterium]|nr:PLP-dependent aminotransferase family protein [Chloroflexota bacterium]
MGWTIDRTRVFEASSGAPRYAAIASEIEAALNRGELRPGDRLPTVRALALELGVSSASVAVAYSLLERRGRVQAHVGRGTFVADVAQVSASSPATDSAWGASGSQASATSSFEAPVARGWRRRVLQFSDRLRAVSPGALACSSSWPDPALLPFELLKRAYADVIEEWQATELQYGGPEAHADLAQAALPRLEADGIVAASQNLLVMSSFGQLLTIVVQLAPTLVGSEQVSVAVEEPGYHAEFNIVENLGHTLIGVGVDEHGALPGSLQLALEAGASIVVLTPRALNPTGATWTARRRDALAAVLREFPRVIIVEDDPFAGLAATAPGSLWMDPLLQERTVYCRSYSKSVGPDMRMTLTLARGRLFGFLRQARLSNGGWSPRIGQRALGALLRQADLDNAFERARLAYAERRRAALGALRAALPAEAVAPTAEGLNLWVRLPDGCDAEELTQHAAHLGVLVSSGEAFYLRPGRRDAVRLSIGRVDAAGAERAGELLAQAVLTIDDMPLSLVV